jgi:hypothetical protein
MTSVVEAARVVNAENWQEVLPRFFGLSRREALEVVAELQPASAPPVRTVVTTSAAPAAVEAPRMELFGSPGELTDSEAAVSPGAESNVPDEPRPAPFAVPAAQSRPADIDPLTATQRRLHMTVSDRFLRKLAEATDALSHSHRGASEEEILEAGLDLLLERAAKRRGETSRPLAEPRPTKTDHIPAHVRRAVFARDGGRCQWSLACGGICGSTRRVQLDHITPRALGGASTVENLRCLCEAHNLLAARQVFGNDWMRRFAPRTVDSVAPAAPGSD